MRWLPTVNAPDPTSPPITLTFEAGTLVAPALPEDPALRGHFTFDARVGVFRAPASAYRLVALRLQSLGVAWEDHARAWEPLPLSLKAPFTPYPHQVEALAAWREAQGRGVVELPTGAGKTLLAVLAIQAIQRPTLVVVPTLELMRQWAEILETHLDAEVGMVGGGINDRRDLTVTTYDSAAMHTEFSGARYGMIVFDECHHLPAPRYRFIAEGSLAPWRLGLTATLARADGGEAVVTQLVGPQVHSTDIRELEGRYLAPYDVKTVEVALTPEEQATHDAARARYLNYLRKSGLRLSEPGGWARFLASSYRSPEGREALDGWRTQRGLALFSAGKVEALWQILQEHRDDRVLVFADDTQTVYRLARTFLLPALTHHTPLAERRALLAGFADGRLPVLLTSRVLNEGVDVPEARIGVVLSGSGTVREHVQRLGRVLRMRPGKRAVLYEVLTRGTAEAGMSERRRQHGAYAGRDGAPTP